MMKAIDVAADAHNRAAADPFWLALFEQLERACKLQLAICPDSSQHFNESLVSPFFDALKRMYEQLSQGVTFESRDQIEWRQLNTTLVAWLDGKEPVYDLNPETITHGGVNDWQTPLIISVDATYPADMVEGIRADRDRMHEAMAAWFERRRKDEEKDFNHFFEIERDGLRTGMVGAYVQWRENQLEAFMGKRPFTLANLSASGAAQHFELIREVVEGSGVTGDEVGKQIQLFLDSDVFRDTPTNRISTLMYAAIAHRAANGQKKPPNRGMANDIGIVSTLLPYCDAMFIDNECRALVENIPKKYGLSYPAQIFSRRDGDAFIDYLKGIEAVADPQMLQEVRDVYGDDWPVPFLNMFEVDRDMRRRRPRTDR